MRYSFKSRRQGAVVVEFAIIAPFLILLIFGIIEFGRAFMVQQILTNASREGARRAILESATAAEVTTLVNEYLTNSSISGASISVAPTILTSVAMGEPVTVTVAVPYHQVSWITPWFLGDRTLSASTLMRAERYQ